MSIIRLHSELHATIYSENVILLVFSETRPIGSKVTVSELHTHTHELL